MAFSAGGGPSSAEMNVTPLIDVLLVLIIIFMIVVTQQKHEGLDAQIPQPEQQSSAKDRFVDRTIVIQVLDGAKDERPGLKINQESVTWENLGNRLHDIFKTRAERIAFVRGEDDVDFQYVADAIDIARGAGVQKLGLLGQHP